MLNGPLGEAAQIDTGVECRPLPESPLSGTERKFGRKMPCFRVTPFAMSFLNLAELINMIS
jgi:hypothetical protein